MLRVRKPDFNKQNLFLVMVTFTYDLLPPKSEGFFPFLIPSICISFISIAQRILKLESGSPILTTKIYF